MPLFAPAPAEVRTAHQRAESEQFAFLARVRRMVAAHYAGSGIEITTDEVHQVMERHGVELPAGASPNLMGSIFSGWPRAESSGGMRRSKRKGAGGNLLITWVIR